MKWKGKELDTAGKLADAITGTTSKEECVAFMEQYRAENPHADHNIGYILGYSDPETRKRIREWIGPAVKHPFFGDTTPTPEEALQKGVDLASKKPTS